MQPKSSVFLTVCATVRLVKHRRFRVDRVDNVTNLLVVKKQVNELGDLDVVDSYDSLITTRSDNQILLICTIIYRDVPYRHAIDMAFPERRLGKDRSRLIEPP